MRNKIEIFKNQELGEVRTLIEDGQIWFVARDISKNLGYTSIEKMYSHVDKEDKKNIDPQSEEYQGSCQNGATLEPNENVRIMTIINESGLYSAIFSSELPSAKKFKRWVTTEVLPSIRKHGIYITEELLKDKEKLQCEIDKIQNEYYELEHRNTDLKFDIKHLQTEKDEIEKENFEFRNQRNVLFKLSIKTNEDESYLPGLVIQLVRNYINNNPDIIINERDEHIFVKRTPLYKELRKLIIRDRDILEVLYSMGMNVQDRIIIIPCKFINSDYEPIGKLYL